MQPVQYPGLGAVVENGGTRFRVWAPKFERVDLFLESDPSHHVMHPSGNGFFERFQAGAGPGTRYRYRLDGELLFPDPASRYQPEGVHGPSEVIDPAGYVWHDQDWPGIPLRDLVLYELHVGAFTPEGTFAAATARLPYLKALGVTAVQLMPVGEFPGRWNWGYDQAALFAPSRAYGRPDELRALVNEAHRLGLAVLLDVVYNHFGPSGAYVEQYGHYHSRKHETEWGTALNFDDEHCEAVRAFFLENALYWLHEFHFDGFRLDATFAIYDNSPKHFLAELAETVHRVEGPPRLLLAEDYRNLNKLVFPVDAGGFGMDALYADDFHHQMRAYTAGDDQRYYADYAEMTSADLAITLRQGWFFTGQHSAFEGEPRGTDPAGLSYERFIFCLQNHDQIGNRAAGERLTDDVPLHAYRAASALLLFVPELPLLFMGQEWGTRRPFPFFTDHEGELGGLVTTGRRKEYMGYGHAAHEILDPQDPNTFLRSRLDWNEHARPEHGGVLNLYRDLLALRPRLEASFQAESPVEGGLVLTRGVHRLLVAFRDGVELPLPAGAEHILHTEQSAYAESGRAPEVKPGAVYFPRAAALLVRGEPDR